MNVEHKGLFAAMAERVDLLNGQWGGNSGTGAESEALMTRRYASLPAADRSKNRVDKFVVAIAWNRSAGEAVATAGKSLSLRLAKLASPDACSTVDRNGRCGHYTLTLRNLQVEHSNHVTYSGRHGITVEEVHETAVHGVLRKCVDIDTFTTDGYLRRCEDLLEISLSGEDLEGRFVVSNFMRYSLGSLTPQNMPRR